MIVVGLSGFEDVDRARRIHPHAGRGPDTALSFGADRVPLQYFPLGLIGHDAAAAILVDGRLVATAAEERFSRQKHGFNLAGRTTLPRRALQYCLDAAGCRWEDVDIVAHYCCFTPDLVAARLRRVGAGLPAGPRRILEREYRQALTGRLAPDLVRAQLEPIVGGAIARERFIAVPHHVAHATAAMVASGWHHALCLSLDGYGEEESALWAVGTRTGITPGGQVLLPNSLGTLYQVVTHYLGFRTFGDEYKTMGLAAYGNPRGFRSVFDELITDDGDSWATRALCRVDLADWLRERLGPVRSPGAYSASSADIAAALQEGLERAVVRQVAALVSRTGLDRLCMAGGVALNACLNGALLRAGAVRQLYALPAAADDGAALGAAWWAFQHAESGMHAEPVRHTFWGPAYNEECIAQVLAGDGGLSVERPAAIEERVAELLSAGRIVGWFQGRMEMGPRALGARSILATPASLTVRDRVNAIVKGRESFRPFGPSVLAEDARDFFEIPDDSAAPFMIVTYRVHPAVRARIPGVVHVDGTARVQIVHECDNPPYHRLLRAFRARTGLGVLLNTSFNRAGEPIVCTPPDAVRCFRQAGLDALAIGPFLVQANGASAGGNA